MSNAVFPDLPGVMITTSYTPLWKTIVQEAVSGKELRAALTAYPRWKIKLSFEFLRSGAEAELQQLVGFFNARRGRFDSFLFLDQLANSATAQTFGTGNATATQFQLVRDFGGFVEPVQNLNGTPQIFKAGTLQASPADYSLSATGLVTFTTAPGSGAALTWTGNYYQRVRFMQDEAEFGRFMRSLYEAKRIDLITEKL